MRVSFKVGMVMMSRDDGPRDSQGTNKVDDGGTKLNVPAGSWRQSAEGTKSDVLC